MNQRVIYPTDDGLIAVIIPSPDCSLSVEKIAIKDVPAGKPFLILDACELPLLETQLAWEADFSKPDGLGGGR